VLILTPASIQMQGVLGVTFMSALPNPLHTQQKKTPGRASRPSKLNQYGRDPQSCRERCRASSDYDTEKGYAPFFHAFLADWPRLSSGHVSDILFMVALSRSLGRSVRKGEPRPTCTAPLLVSDLAALCGCDERSIQRELAGWQTRQVARITPEGKGVVSIELLYRDWESLPDYKNVVDISTGVPIEDETSAEDEKAKEHTCIDLTKAPLSCKAGGRSKGVKVDCGVKTFHLVNPSVVDLEITAMVQAGDLVITTKVPDEWLQKAVKRGTVSNDFNELGSATRHGRHLVPGKPGNPVTAKQGNPVTHPRAPELVKLFDPLLAASAARLLSGDSSSLLAACEAVGECDHNFLVKFAVQRAERPVKSPLHVKTICAEALASWKASKVLDGAGLFPQDSVKKKSFAEGVLADVKRRLARDGKI
jgi:hypothetical protein